MENLKIQYDKIVTERKTIINQINDLKNNDIIKKYFDLCNQNNELVSQQRDLYKQIKISEYSSCNHIWVNTLQDHDRYEGRSYNYYGCIKCGLDQRVFQLAEQYPDLNWLTFEQRIMYDFMKGRFCFRKSEDKILCDLDLAKEIYKKIKEKNPNIDDKTVEKYLKIELKNKEKNDLKSNEHVLLYKPIDEQKKEN